MDGMPDRRLREKTVMSECDPQLLSAYHDGEISAPDRERLEQHVAQCAACAGALSRLRETSRLLAGYPEPEIDARTMDALHRAIDDASDEGVWRLGVSLALVAASVVIIGLAWLREMPRPAPPQPRAVATVAQPDWERVAMTLHTDTLPEQATDATQLADARMADWMLEGLSPRSPR